MDEAKSVGAYFDYAVHVGSRFLRSLLLRLEHREDEDGNSC